MAEQAFPVRSIVIGAVIGAIVGVVAGLVIHAIVTDHGSATGYAWVAGLIGFVFGGGCGAFYGGYFAIRREK